LLRYCSSVIFFLLRAYGDTLRSTHLFITRNTVFYPIAFINLIAGVLLLSWLIYIIVKYH